MYVKLFQVFGNVVHSTIIHSRYIAQRIEQCNCVVNLGWTGYYVTIRYDTIEEINVDSKAEYTA